MPLIRRELFPYHFILHDGTSHISSRELGIFESFWTEWMPDDSVENRENFQAEGEDG